MGLDREPFRQRNVVERSGNRSKVHHATAIRDKTLLEASHTRLTVAGILL